MQVVLNCIKLELYVAIAQNLCYAIHIKRSKSEAEQFWREGLEEHKNR